MDFDLKDVKKLRIRAGLKQAELGRKAGVSQSLIAKIESGKADPAYSKLKAVLEALEDSEKDGEALAGEVMNRSVISIGKGTPVLSAIKLMKEKGISQLPVIEKGQACGSLSEENVLDGIQKFGHEKVEKLKVGQIMGPAFLSVREGTPAKTVAQILKREKAVLVLKGEKIVGIITKVDLL